MPTNYGHSAYNNSYYESMDPKGLILLLYKGALKHLKLAKEGMLENDVKKRGKHLSRVIDIVSELNSCLDSKVQDESIAFLRGLYRSILLELPQASANNNIKTLNTTASYLFRLQEIWENDVMEKTTDKNDLSKNDNVILISRPKSQTYDASYGHNKMSMGKSFSA